MSLYVGRYHILSLLLMCLIFYYPHDRSHGSLAYAGNGGNFKDRIQSRGFGFEHSAIEGEDPDVVSEPPGPLATRANCENSGKDSSSCVASNQVILTTKSTPAWDPLPTPKRARLSKEERRESQQRIKENAR